MHEKGSVTRGLRGPLVVRGVYVLYTPPPHITRRSFICRHCANKALRVSPFTMVPPFRIGFDLFRALGHCFGVLGTTPKKFPSRPRISIPHSQPVPLQFRKVAGES